MRPVIIIAAALALLVTLVGCTTTQQDTERQGEQELALERGTYREPVFNTSAQLKPQTFSSQEEFEKFAQEHEGSSGTYYGGVDVVRQRPNMARAQESFDAAPTQKVGGDAGANRDFSRTNNQVAGVDEADIIKTDGDYIYTLSKDTLYIIKAYPGEDAQLTSSISFDNSPEHIFVKDDKLAVFGDFSDNEFFKNMSFRPQHGMTFFSVYDITNRSQPQQIKDYKFEGRYFNARMIDGHVYLLTQNEFVRRHQHPTPVIIEDRDVRSMPVGSISHYPVPYDNPELVSVHGIDLQSPDSVSSSAVTVEDGENLYMSEDNLYITYTERIREHDMRREIMQEMLEPHLTESDKELIKKIKQTDNAVLSQSEKERKIEEVYETVARYLPQEKQEKLEDRAEKKLKEKLQKFDYFEHTVITRIQAAEGDISVEATGKVPGHVINQFSMSEHKNTFRIATTLSSRWSHVTGNRTESENHVYTLDQDLKIQDRLTGLARTEEIYSTRFMGDRLYMVTFRQVDPFFVIDLSDPADIENLGKLKIPGFSRYLHPYGDDTIIGIGRNATETGRSKGLKISLFDVSDVSDPQQVESYVTDERHARSEALYEHKAFLFSREKNLLVIPAYTPNYYGHTEGQNYNGAFVFNISKDEIDLRGLIDHSMGEHTYRSPSVQRSLYIEDLLYTKSQNLLRINALSDLHAVKNLTLEKEQQDIPVY